MTEIKETQKGLPVTILECALVLMILCLFVGGLGLGIGFYFGTRTAQSSAGDVAYICSKAIKAYEGQIKEVNTLRNAHKKKIKYYEDSLVDIGVESGFTISKSLLPKKPRKAGIGGPKR